MTFSEMWRRVRQRFTRTRPGCTNPEGIAYGRGMGANYNNDWAHHLKAIQDVTKLPFRDVLMYRLIHEAVNSNMRLGMLLQQNHLATKNAENPFAVVDKSGL